MRNILNFILGVMLAFLLITAVNAWSAETMQACTQADGSAVYTNKDVKGCATIKLPELSIVPDRKAVMVPETTVVSEIPVVTPTAPKLVAGSVLAETCALYRDWVRINERTMGGFEYNTVDDTKKRLMLTKIFGSGFSPYGCQ